MASYGKKSPVKRFTAGAVHRCHKIVAVLRPQRADFYLLTVAQLFDCRIVGWLDQERISLLDYRQSECWLYRSTSRLPVNEPWHLLHLNGFQIWGDSPSSTLIWI